MEVLVNYVVSQPEWDVMKPLYVHIKKMRIVLDPTRLLEMVPTLKPPTDILLRFYSSGLDDFGQTSKVQLNGSWSPVLISELHPLKYQVGDLRFIRVQKLIATLHKVEGHTVGECFGQAVFSLAGALISHPQQLTSAIERYSRVMGELTFEYLLSV
jgi:hypothetical protein